MSDDQILPNGVVATDASNASPIQDRSPFGRLLAAIVVPARSQPLVGLAGTAGWGPRTERFPQSVRASGGAKHVHRIELRGTSSRNVGGKHSDRAKH